MGCMAIAAAHASGQTPDDCQKHRRYGRLDEAAQCYSRLLASSDPYFRAEGRWGLEQYSEANDQFRLAVEAKPKNAHFRVRWGMLYLANAQPVDAAGLFGEALEIDKDNAQALLGLARVASRSFEAKAVQLAEAALKADSNLVEAQELLSFLALEDVDEGRAVEEADKALAMSDEAMDAMAIHATIELLNDRDASPWFERIRKINPVRGEAYATAAHFFVLNRRYEEGIKLYEQALALNPRLWKARSELGLNLMRLGREEEARRHLEACYDNNYASDATVNTLRLLDSYKNYQTFRTDKTIVRLASKEAELLRPYFESELKRAIATFEKKYKLTLPRAVQLEVYPNHEDFAVRTLGMPGLGALGVTFGDVVAMDSPSGRRPGTFHWASTLWHELSHVFVLTATKHRVPRWFTEGMAVHEETAASPEWGDRMDPQIITAIKEEKLLPVAGLDRGFIRPSYPGQVIVSYFQAGRICDYINERWGYDKLLAMMRAFGERKTTSNVIEEQLEMKPEAFDKDFLAWLRERTRTTVDGFDEWKKGMKTLTEAAYDSRHDQVLDQAPALRDLYPEYVEDGNPYELLADAHLANGNKDAAMAELERYARAGGRKPDTLKKLARLQEEKGKRKDAIATLERLNYVYPVNDEELHRWLGDLALSERNMHLAIREFKAVIAMNPHDRAASEFNLAKAYRAANRDKEAMNHVVLALEAAPGYRPAQKMLLELSSEKKEN
ncbi:MAG: tetratricopeptide repeat protein [Bryobacteraceae bacterium]|nr:tetratricopeptide repeat protein [Bryobacteraceae bacterium]